MKNELSLRLRSVAALCKPAECIADVGCDHGFMSIYLVSHGICQKAVAMDVNRGPLARCTEHVTEEGLLDVISVRLSDGLAAVCPGEADAAVIAGMGGPLMRDILIRGEASVLKMQYLTLQPQSEIPEFRSFLRRAGFVFDAEDMVFEDGKYYPMMRVFPPKSGFSAVPTEGTVEFTDYFGPCLLKDLNPSLKLYITERINRLTEILKGLPKSSEERRRELSAELTDMERALHEMQ